MGVEPYLKELLPKITVDGKVGRQMSQAKKVTDELKAKGALGDYVILELGTNGPFNKEQLRKVLTSLSDAKQVLVVTTRVPKGWQDTVNSTIKDVVPEFDNAKVVDWYAASEGERITSIKTECILSRMAADITLLFSCKLCKNSKDDEGRNTKKRGFDMKLKKKRIVIVASIFLVGVIAFVFYYVSSIYKGLDGLSKTADNSPFMR